MEEEKIIKVVQRSENIVRCCESRDSTETSRGRARKAEGPKPPKGQLAQAAWHAIIRIGCAYGVVRRNDQADALQARGDQTVLYNTSFVFVNDKETLGENFPLSVQCGGHGRKKLKLQIKVGASRHRHRR